MSGHLGQDSLRPWRLFDVFTARSRAKGGGLLTLRS